MKSILTMAWTAEDPSAFDLAARFARNFNARLVGLEPPSYGVMSMAWADAGMGAPIGGGLAEDAEERQRVAAVKQAFDQRAAGLNSEWRSADDSGPTASADRAAYDQSSCRNLARCRRCRKRVRNRIVRFQPVCGATCWLHGRQRAILFAGNGSTESARDFARNASAEPRRGDRRPSVDGAMVPGPTPAEIGVAATPGSSAPARQAGNCRPARPLSTPRLPASAT
jgi:hypothetical protein